MGAKDGLLQVALDGSGKRLKQYIATGVPQADGTYKDVYISCLTLVDSDGNEVSLETTNRLLRQVLEEVRIMRAAVGEMFDSPSAMLGRDVEGDNIVDDAANAQDELGT